MHPQKDVIPWEVMKQQGHVALVPRKQTRSLPRNKALLQDTYQIKEVVNYVARKLNKDKLVFNYLFMMKSVD